MKHALVLLVLTVLRVPRADAQYNILGSGVGSCRTWAAERRASSLGYTAVQSMQWVLGYLSGIGFVGEDGADPLNNVDARGVWAWIDNYCQSHPIDHIVGTAKAF